MESKKRRVLSEGEPKTLRWMLCSLALASVSAPRHSFTLLRNPTTSLSPPAAAALHHSPPTSPPANGRSASSPTSNSSATRPPTTTTTTTIPPPPLSTLLVSILRSGSCRFRWISTEFSAPRRTSWATGFDAPTRRVSRSLRSTRSATRP